MNALATTTIAVLRHTTTNDYGDEVDADNTVATMLPAALTERQRTVTNPVDGNPRVVRHTTARVRADADVRKGDRVRDERTGAIYLVGATYQVTNPAISSDLTLELTRTN